MEIKELKQSQLEELANYRERLKRKPSLSWLFFEITDRCNLRCKHCGSNCTSTGELLTVEDVKSTLKTLKGAKPMICLTGGEPLLHPDFFEIAECVHSMGFRWGMTTNATLIDEAVAKRLKEVGMKTVSVSIDGLEECHDNFRQQKGAWKKAINGLIALKNEGFSPQVTTAFSPESLKDIDALYNLICDMGIIDWRPINVEPIGRACESSDLLLSSEQLSYLISYIRKKRYDLNCNINVTFGCSHYLGVDYERMVRDHYFFCTAGISTASVRSNGDICACLDVENLPELVQGNIRHDNFMDVWKNRFKAFRGDRTADCDKCINCTERFVCGGDSAHTWDFKAKKPLLCYKDFGEVLNNYEK